MINITQQVEHWRKGAAEDWEVAKDLVKRGRIRHGLFFAHLTLEKLLKSYACEKHQKPCPTDSQPRAVGRVIRYCH